MCLLPFSCGIFGLKFTNHIQILIISACRGHSVVTWRQKTIPSMRDNSLYTSQITDRKAWREWFWTQYMMNFISFHLFIPATSGI